MFSIFNSVGLYVFLVPVAMLGQFKTVHTLIYKHKHLKNRIKVPIINYPFAIFIVIFLLRAIM